MLIFLFLSFIFSFFAMAVKPAAADIKCAALMFGALAVLATANYFIGVLVSSVIQN
jgi:choline transport protein